MQKNQAKSLILSEEEEIEAYNDALRDLCLDNFYVFLKEICGYKDVNWSTHGNCVTGLTAKTFRKLLVMPRGSLKSTIACVAFPIWLLCKWPNLRIYLDSEVFKNSKNYIREIQGIVSSQKFVEIFGEWRHKDLTWNSNEMIIATRNVHLREASITVGSVGTIKVGQHYDVIIGDDYNSPKNSDTPEGLEKVIRHYKYNQSILEPPGIWPIGLYVIIGTRYAARDLIGYVATEELGLEQEFESGEFNANAPNQGLLLF